MGGYLSTPRDFSSPLTNVRVIDQNGAPVSGLEVGRSWYDSDSFTDGHETIRTGTNGVASFPKIPANVGLFTGTLRKVVTSFLPCGSGSGTWTTIYVRFPDYYEVVPKDKLLHKSDYSSVADQDQDGITFSTDFDSESNTMANLSFPKTTKMIDYALSAKKHGR